MPKLLLFAPCEKVIVDQNNVLSIVSVLQEVTVTLPTSASPPSDANAPMQWAILAFFQKEPGDDGKTFEQRSALVAHNGSVLLETPVAAFEFKLPHHRVVHQIAGMPIGNAGKHAVKTWLREKGAAQWKEIGEFPLEIKWAQPPTLH